MRRLGTLAVLLFAAGAVRAEEKPFFFQKGDRVVFLGDSITEQYEYSTDIELYLTTRFPEWKIFFLNAGINGDTAHGGAGRFKRHVLDEKPTAITIDFGMNDAGYKDFNQASNDHYVKKTTEMLEAARNAGVRVALISPNVVDPRVQERFKLYRETQKRFYAPLKELAEKYGAAYVDQYAVTRKALEQMEKDDPSAKKVKPFGDGFHTASGGGLLMAHTILVGLNAPALVSEVVIDNGQAQTQRCQVSMVQANADRLSFVRTDEAAPMPVQEGWLPVLPYVNDLKDLNWYGLKVKGLKKGKWALSIDGKEVGEFDARQLAEGVNLGNLRTGPVFEHAQKVFQAINKKNEINKKRFRGTILSPKPDEKVIAELLESLKQKQTEIYEMMAPKTYAFDLKLVK